MNNAAEKIKGREFQVLSAVPTSSRVFSAAVLVAALGYFVDVFDMWLFANFRVAQLTSLGLVGTQITEWGAHIINYQQAGFLIGGLCWGIFGDKRGRISVLFGSIFLYSVATLLTAYVTSPSQLAWLRGITGFGLAGEIGAGITLISELLPKESRGYGTAIVATIGVAGAIGAAIVGKYMHWESAYILGAVLGFGLLGLRILVAESGMYSEMKRTESVKCGSLIMLFSSWARVIKFVACILVGVPIYLVFSQIVVFSPEIGASLGIKDSILVPDVMLFASIGITIGDLGFGFLGQWLGSRKKPIFIGLFAGAILALLLTGGFIQSAAGFKYMTGAIGLCMGYWACLVTAIAEQFGTNLRATVTTFVPNLIRASAIILNIAFINLNEYSTPAHSVFLLCIPVFVLAFVSLILLKDTFGKDLNYIEK